MSPFKWLAPTYAVFGISQLVAMHDIHSKFEMRISQVKSKWVALVRSAAAMLRLNITFLDVVQQPIETSAIADSWAIWWHNLVDGDHKALLLSLDGSGCFAWVCAPLNMRNRLQ
ncbi:unnamed protein product [Ostreobium quekettii]|uniref:Uncharacterized protein n=1 Tax=Ostreobium quekettii TaxID=121088 RepID=A0A8S1IN92_9CHLO|nr:unnamed protein product [Ostreobium quekettii]